VAIETTGEVGRQHLHRRRKERGKAQRVRGLRQQHYRQVLREQCGHGPAQAGTDQCDQQHPAGVVAAEEAADGEEHAHFEDHADGPQQAQGGGTVTVMVHVDREERVVRAERQLLHERGQEERQHRRSAHDLPEAAGIPRRPADVARVMVAEGRGNQQHEQGQHHPGQQSGVAAGAIAFDQPAEQGDHGDETERAPDPDQPVAMAVVAQVGEGDRLELRHHRVVEEAEHDHRRVHPRLRQGQQEGGEAEQGQHAADAQ